MENPNRVEDKSRVEHSRRPGREGPETPGEDATREGQASICVAVVAGVDGPAYRFESWLSSTYETEIVTPDELFGDSVGADVVVADRQTLASQGTVAVEDVARLAENYQTIVIAAADQEVCYVDDCLVKPVSRDDLLNAVETARRVTIYDDTIEELLSLTAQRRALCERSSSDRANERPTFVRVSERIDELHSRIERTLADVEGRYSELLSEKRRRPTVDTGEDPR